MKRIKSWSKTKSIIEKKKNPTFNNPFNNNLKQEKVIEDVVSIGHTAITVNAIECTGSEGSEVKKIILDEVTGKNYFENLGGDTEWTTNELNLKSK